MAPSTRPIVCVMNWLPAAMRSCSSHAISTMRQPSRSKNCRARPPRPCGRAVAVLHAAGAVQGQHALRPAPCSPVRSRCAAPAGRRATMHTTRWLSPTLREAAPPSVPHALAGPSRARAARKFAARCIRSGSGEMRTRSNIRLSPAQLPAPLSGPNMGCVHSTSTWSASAHGRLSRGGQLRLSSPGERVTGASRGWHMLWAPA